MYNDYTYKIKKFDPPPSFKIPEHASKPTLLRIFSGRKLDLVIEI